MTFHPGETAYIEGKLRCRIEMVNHATQMALVVVQGAKWDAQVPMAISLLSRERTVER